MKKNSKKKKGWGWLLFLLAMLGIAGAYLYFSGWVNQWMGKETRYTLKDTGVVCTVETAEFYTESLGEYVLCAGKTGIKAIDKEGAIRWDVTYTMQTPRLLACGDYALVADYGGNEAVLISSEGNKTEIYAEAQILFASLGENGWVLLATTDDTQNVISLYDAAGTLKLRRVTYQSQDGIPTAAAVSSDGKRLAASYVLYTQGTLCTNITVFDLSDNGKNLTDRILGNYQSEELIGLLSFSDYNCFYAGDESFGVLKMDKGCSLAWSENPDYELTFAAVTDSVLAVCFGERKAGTAKEAENDFFIYNIEGENVYQTKIGGPVSLSADEEVFVCGTDYYFKAVNSHGKELWEAELTLKAQRVLPVAGNGYAAVVGTDRISFYEIKGRWEVDE